MKGVKYHGPSPPHKGSWRLPWPTYPGHDGIYVDGWRINSYRLYHKHPAKGEMPETEYDVNERVCWLCGATCPDEIWFAHRLQQL